jgi:hypothetical protein
MPPRSPAAAIDPAVATDADLDGVLAVQLAVAWAGETVGGEERLGWWRTELTDPDAGGDFLARLLPRTHAWAALAAVREAAGRVDEAARRRCRGRTSDAIWSLFHFGFAWDERLFARLSELRQGGKTPGDAFGSAWIVRDRFDRTAFTRWLGGLAGKVATEVVPDGQELAGRPASPMEAAPKLAAALLPLKPRYPLPFFSMSGP